jgi:membrane protein YqaA with SNARE-associated domain
MALEKRMSDSVTGELLGYGAMFVTGLLSATFVPFQSEIRKRGLMPTW